MRDYSLDTYKISHLARYGVIFVICLLRESLRDYALFRL